MELVVTIKNKDVEKEPRHRTLDEVVSEIRRRAAGNYLFSNEENERRLAEALEKVNFLFRLAEHWKSFLEREKVTMDDVIEVLGLKNSMEENGLIIALEPFPKGVPENPIKDDVFIDFCYPGKDYNIERSPIRGVEVFPHKEKGEINKK